MVYHAYMAIHPASIDPEKLLEQCDVTRGRASGPGGQHRNKVETAVTLIHRPTQVVGYAAERRSLAENLRVALKRLRFNLAVEVRFPVDPFEPASALWKSRLQKGRVIVSVSHADFPAILAEAMDMLAASKWDISAASAALGCTPSQLVKLLKDEPRAIRRLNEERQRAGLRIMK